jgi:DNA-binding winged helix-turn-helix (wHTH) protein/Tol biopolymer transport system component
MSDQLGSICASAEEHVTHRSVRFGPYELRPFTRELLKDGRRIHVQPKPLQVLHALVSRPGELVTREELCRELWPDGTFVDFESGLNTATNRLRAALRDCAERPAYIETLPRLGYRFICPVVYDEPGKNHDPITIEAGPATASAPRYAEIVPVAPAPAIPPSPARRQTAGRAMLFGSGVIVAVALAGCVLVSMPKVRRDPVFRPLTFQTQNIVSAGLLSDATGAVYTTSSAAGKRTVEVHLDGKSSEIKQEQKPVASFAVNRSAGIQTTIEFPKGRVVYRSNGCITDVRVSPNGEYLAFIEHANRNDDRGYIRMLGKTGASRQLTVDWNSASGLAWTPSGREIWFTASKSAAQRSLYAVSLDGKLRQISDTPASLRLFDISPRGSVLVSVDEMTGSMFAGLFGTTEEQDVTQFDMPGVLGLSHDGKQLLFVESGDAGGPHYTTMLFDFSAHSARTVVQGRPLAISPDGRSALVLDPRDDRNLALVNLESRASRRISGANLHYQWARFTSENAILAGASEDKRDAPLLLYRQVLNGGAPAPVTGMPYIDDPAISPDGSKIAGITGTQTVLLDLCSKSAKPLNLKQYLLPVTWSLDGRFLFLASMKDSQILKLDLTTQSLTEWKRLQRLSAGSGMLAGIAAAPEAGTYAYSLYRNVSRLFMVDGWS